MLTDGNKEAVESNLLVLHQGPQWVQIDLGQPARVSAIAVWHGDPTLLVVHDVVVQIADDAGFTANVRTLFNNDYDNSAGLGTGHDREYFESYEGRLIHVMGDTARYVRLYSNGSNHASGNTPSPANRYTEVEVYGSP